MLKFNWLAGSVNVMYLFLYNHFLKMAAVMAGLVHHLLDWHKDKQLQLEANEGLRYQIHNDR